MEKFGYEANGYNRNEVNQFIDNVVKETEEIILKAQRQAKEIEELKKELDYYKEVVKEMEKTKEKLKKEEPPKEEKSNSESNAINISDEIKNEIIRLAKEESEIIVTDAKHNASRIVNEALLKAEQIEVKTDLIESKLKILKRKMHNVIAQQQAVVEEVEDLDIEE